MTIFNTTKINKIAILFIFIFVIIIDLLLCYLFYYNRNRILYFNLNDFVIDNSTENAVITSISHQNDCISIQGNYYKDISNYQIYIGIKRNNNMDIYRTELIDTKEKIFQARIKNININEESEIFIIYMCDNQKIQIQTNRLVGETI